MSDGIKAVFPEDAIRLILLSGGSPDLKVNRVREEIERANDDVAKVETHVREALRFTADLPCRRANCGSVCLCGPCHARRAVAVLDPEYRPKVSKNHRWRDEH